MDLSYCIEEERYSNTVKSIKKQVPMGNQISNDIAEYSAMDPISMEDLITLNADFKVQSKNLAIIRIVSGIISTISSSTLIWMIVRSQEGICTTQHRILLGLSIFDIVSSLTYATFSTTAAPSDINYYMWNARGDQTTCTVQGFLIGVGVLGGLWYNAALNYNFLVVMQLTMKNKRGSTREEYIRTKVEPFLHGAPIVVALGYNITLWMGDHFNDNGYGVCINPVHYPSHCHGYDVGEVREGFEIPCGRGFEGAWAVSISSLVFMSIPIIIMGFCLGKMYIVFRKLEKKRSGYGWSSSGPLVDSTQPQGSQRTTSTSTRSSLGLRISKSLVGMISCLCKKPLMMSDDPQTKRSRAVMHKAFGYSFAWLLSYGVYTLGRVIELITREYPLGLSYPVSLFCPLQGFFNIIIYMYPHVISVKKKGTREGGNNISWCQAILIAFGENNISCCKAISKPSCFSRGNDDVHVQENVPGQIMSNHSHHAQERQEEEKKYEIQPPPDGIPSQKVQFFTYASNTSPVVTDTDEKGISCHVSNVSKNNDGDSHSDGEDFN